MTFRTALKAEKSAIQISHNDHTLCMGSCFAEHMGRRMADGKFKVLTNPYGIVYNPISLEDGIFRLMGNVEFEESDLFERDGLWHSFRHHGHFSGPDPEETLKKINNAYREGMDFMMHCNRLLLTLGTAHVFEHVESGLVVANCHKAPGNQFRRYRLSVHKIIETLIPLFESLKWHFPSIEVIVTVSPIRHLRDGFVENQRSKAILLLAASELCQRFDYVHYFPAYELMLDDLRDYRFYGPDLIHPNETAIQYIWDFFENTYFGDDTRQLLREIRKIRQSLTHRSFRPDTEAHQAFKAATLQKMDNMEKDYPQIDWGTEKTSFLAGAAPEGKDATDDDV